MSRTFRPTHLLALIAAVFITSTAFSTAMTVPAAQPSAIGVTLA